MEEELRQLLANELANDLARAIEGMTGEQPKLALTFKAEGPLPGWPAWKQRFNVSSGASWVCAEPGTWLALGRRALQAAGIEDEDPGIARSTFEELLGQAFSMLARSLTGRTGREWTTTEGVEYPEPRPGENWTGIRLEFSDGTASGVLVTFEDALARAVAPEPPAPVASATKEVAIAAPAAAAAVKSKTLDLLMDVELPVSVSFGRAQLPLKDVIKLTTGSIVELNRTIMEPVEVIVNNCVIARGEVVVVEGNFGVRIQQVISREERLRSLF